MAEHSENNNDVMSPDDIEKLLLSASEESVAPEAPADGNSAKSSASEEKFEPEASENDIITLEDVDRLMDVALESDIDLEAGDTESETEDTTDSSATGEKDFVSQDDIDTLLQGIAPEDRGEKDTPSTGEEGQVISQDDIDTILGRDDSKDISGIDERDFVSQDDIDNLLKDDEAQTPPEKDSDENAETQQDHVSQDDIDSLFQDAEADPGEKGGGAGGKKKERSIFIDQGELDQLLTAYEEKDRKEPPNQPAEQEPSAMDSEEEEDSILVSQDEINKLIGDIQDEEGDEEEAGQDTSFKPAKSEGGDVISQDDIDRLLSAPLEDGELDDIKDVDDSNKVILDAEKKEGASGEADTAPGDKWFKNRYIIASAASFLVITCASILFLIFRTPADDGERKKIIQTAAVAPTGDAPVDPSLSDADKLINLKNFVVMAPPEREDITLITTHVSITLRDVEAADLIRKNKTFFRGIVYNTVLEALIPKEQEKSVNKLILTSGIKTALNKALPESSVQKVVLNDLNLI